VFLDQDGSACLLHTRFGVLAKPVGCRLYPLQVAPTFEGCVSVSARMDCPAVQSNVGLPLHNTAGEVRQLVRILSPDRWLDADDCGKVCEESIRKLVSFLRSEIVARADLPPRVRCTALVLAAERLEHLTAPFLNDMPVLEQVLPSFIGRVLDRVQRNEERGIGVFWRVAFRLWLSCFLRRDEELIGAGGLARLRRFAAVAAFATGHGRLSGLGAEHPDVRQAAVGLFAGGWMEVPDAWDCYRRWIDARLETFQFMGSALQGRDFFTGLRALGQTGALVLVTARFHAAGRGDTTIEAEDVQYAVGAIDHGFGRSALLGRPLVRYLERSFDFVLCLRLAAGLGW
jgi:hypothetical protein